MFKKKMNTFLVLLKQKRSLIALIILAILAVSVFVVIVLVQQYSAVPNQESITNNSQVVLSTPVEDNVQIQKQVSQAQLDFKPPVSNTITETESLLPYTIEGKFEYSYPSTWKFAKGRDGIGLYPSGEEKFISGNHEMLTIFSTPSNKSPREWGREYDGFGYEVEEDIVVNGYQTYYVEHTGSSFKDIIYVMSNNGLIARVRFRIQENISGIDYDYSKYLDSVTKIINSIRFLN